MSAQNSIVQDGRAPDASNEQTGFELPPALAARYEVRIVDGADGEQRIGLFRPIDRDGPSIEITNDRIVARTEDAETVAALVKIAQHSGWDRIAVDGSPEFRQAVWEAATREGLAVRGYEPSFSEQERMEQARSDAAHRGGRDAQEQLLPERKPDVSDAAPQQGASASPDPSKANDIDGQILSAGDRRLLMTLSRHAEDRKTLKATTSPDMDAFSREVHLERLESNRDALDTALDRALESPTLATVFERSGFAPDALRALGKGETIGEIADAVDLVRSGEHRKSLTEDNDASDLRFQIDRWDPSSQARVFVGATNSPSEAITIFESEIDTRLVDNREGKTVGSTEWVNDGSFPRWRVSPEMKALVAQEKDGTGGFAQDATTPARESLSADREPLDVDSDRRRESDELAEIFLHGAGDRIAADPRLTGAREAQTAMELHIGEVFGGDADRMASASLESRQMISDVLRRGLDVSVREPTPVRQLEPVQIRPDMER